MSTLTVFDRVVPRDQELVLKDGMRVESIDCLINPVSYRRQLLCYMICLILQYFSAFSLVPLDWVANRPSLNVLSAIYTIIVFAICAVLFSFSISVVPTRSTVTCFIISTVLQFSCLILSVSSTVSCLQVDEMYMSQRDEATNKYERVVVTKYFQITACVSMASNALAFAFSLVGTLIGYRSLHFLNNHIDRRKRKSDSSKQFSKT